MKTSKKYIIGILVIFAAAILTTLTINGFLKGSNSNVSTTPTPTPQEVVNTNKNEEVRAMWISYLEYQQMNMATKEGFVSDITTMFNNCKNMGINTMIVQVRPFGDALYNSSVFPSSHFITGTQGDALPYDPLEEMITIAHGLGLKIEAWINPYRVQSGSKNPPVLSSNNPANDTSLTISVDGNIYYNPALEEVHNLVIDGVLEIIKNYNVDGIHFDDYFYPSTDPSIDAKEYAQYGGGLSLDDWRRENVNTLIKKVYKAIKDYDKNIVFGISPQGNNDNNYNFQYSDVSLWLNSDEYVDYIMPQLYWGFDYLTASGNTQYQFKNLIQEWSNYPRNKNVNLYIGLGAYRIGVGDGGASDQSEWKTGDNIAKMINYMSAQEDVTGWAIYRYDSLYRAAEYQDIANKEIQAITNENIK